MLQSISMENALSILEDCASTAGSEEIPVVDSFERILAEDIVAGFPLPPFHRSPLDGYALRAEDTAGADRDNPVTLRIVQSVYSGSLPDRALLPGETTFLEKLIRELKNRKIRVGTVKHDVHGFEIDKPGKDTWRHAQAGADAVTISSPSTFAMIRQVEEEMSLDQIIEQISRVDIILVEGFKRSTKPKIEINRMAQSGELLSRPEDLLAVVSDADWNIGVPFFGLNDASGVADMLVEKYQLPAL